MRACIKPVIVAALLVATLPSAARAQARRPYDGVGIRGVLTYGTTKLSATQTFTAIAGSDRKAGVGFGVEVANLFKHLFVGVSMAPVRLEGRRAWILGDTVYPIGIPTEIKIRPIDIVAGWRTTAGPVEPFGGAGISMTRYTETSDYAEAGDNVSVQKQGFVLVGGVDYRADRWVRFGGEVRYRSVSGILGSGGISQAFNESSLGGVSATFRIVVGR